MSIPDLLLKFLKKYFFILKAAADGWRIRYIGGNQFEFYSSVNNSLVDHSLLTNLQDTHTFIRKYLTRIDV